MSTQSGVSLDIEPTVDVDRSDPNYRAWLK